MADEITLNLKLRFAKGGTDVTFAPAVDLKIDVAGSQLIHHIQSVGTSEEALTLGDVAAGGYFICINRDATNFVELRSGTGATDFIRLKAGDACCFRLSNDATAPFAIADTAACEIEYYLIEA